MKYIKQYETNTIELNLKKYIIWKSSVLNIFEVLKHNNKTELSLERLFIYTDDVGLMSSPFKKYDTNVILEISDIKKDALYSYIKYQSDNLQDCIDNIKILTTTAKYNL